MSCDLGEPIIWQLHILFMLGPNFLIRVGSHQLQSMLEFGFSFKTAVIQIDELFLDNHELDHEAFNAVSFV